MIDFKSIKLTAINKYSFVGIEKKEGILCFYLPKGFSENIDELSGFSKKRDLFFLFYKIFDVFRKICAEKGYLDKVDEFAKKDRDGVIKSIRGSGTEDDGDDSENIFYSKLDIIGSLLDVYDEPKILSLAYRLGRSDKFDVSQIHKYLHQAVYLPNNAAYVDQMLLPKKVLQFESTDIVSIYCYLFCEVKQQLKESVSTEITSLSERFREKYLRSSDSLFEEQSYEHVLDILKDALETINHNTPIKDADYWEYYEAIELFLYGDLNKEEDGEIWGVSNFHSVWESMCLIYIAQNTDSSDVLHLDCKYVSNIIVEIIQASTKNIILHNTFKVNDSFLNPDAVIFSSVINQIRVDKIDYKINSSSWDDYGYKTSIEGDIACNIAYIGQPTGIYSIEKLREFYPFDERRQTIRINRRLPLNFYSFWHITNDISNYDLVKMHNFNHLFYIALEKHISIWDDFVQEILQPLNISCDDYSSYFHKSFECNVFTDSFFRNLTPQELKEKFTSFIKLISNRFNSMFNFDIIDIKYMNSDYFKDSTKIEEIKSRSVRKQFVYEYLLQKYLDQRKDKFSDLPIRSSFWLPSYRPDDPNLIEEGETFMDGYIQLKNINFAVLAENYIA
ncbi:hypothetical protein [Phormidium tenue]|uniref:Uncharacterized protein n=1 Tax=Phormidium tenue FACHB-1050 TaxID=2692857 RepID=A0ABR8CD06_9CYAN|nr:hypothetical protein [Phormidium tenue]MBD2317581.1 hypothetical protein [Phormidium tenue FACHB-1050]